MRRCLKGFMVVVGVAAVLPPSSPHSDDSPNPTVGMPAHLEQIVLPGSELEVKPLDDPRGPIVLRIESSYPHGTACRYDLVYYGLEPGTFDLKDYLRRKDGSSTSDLPAIPVQVRALLPPGQILPNPLKAKDTPSLGGYRLALAAAGVLWVLGLLAILFIGRRKRRHHQMAEVRPLTVAERLRPLVEKAIAGGLPRDQLAELERTLLALWRQRLGLEETKAAEAVARLRAHPEAGPLVEQLERWLHRPGGGGGVDVAALLGPYRSIPHEPRENAHTVQEKVS